MYSYIEEFDNTMDSFERGWYEGVGGNRINIYSTGRLTEAKVWLQEDMDALQSDGRLGRRMLPKNGVKAECMAEDSFSQALKRRMEGERDILVMNFADPVIPGGGVRNGAAAQEESLCRRSSLLLSLESAAARTYYMTHAKMKGLGAGLATDAVIISPHVTIIKDETGVPMEKPIVVSVLTCAAPMVFGKAELRMPDAEYERLFRRRIMGVLFLACRMGYTRLIAGAWGCGAFGNNPWMVAKLFGEALRNLSHYEFDGTPVQLSVDFAVKGGKAYMAFANEFGVSGIGMLESKIYRKKVAQA